VGKHSSDSQIPFIRSVVGWFLPWFLVAIVVAVGIWVAVDALGGDDLKTPKPVAAESSEPPLASSTPEKSDPSASSKPAETAEPKDPKDKPGNDKPKPEKSKEPEELITAEVTIQVLNGTSNPAADDQMADQLATLGFEVVAVAGSSKAYSATTVFYSFPEAQEAAERLAARHGWAVAAKPSNLSATVDIHVVVGDDYS
jgi:cytoskeletal protein RodZ